MTGLLFLIANFFLRVRSRKSNYFRAEDEILTDHYFVYWKNKSKGRIALLIYFILLCIVLAVSFQVYQVSKTAFDSGLQVILPPKKENQADIKIKERNILFIQVNSSDVLMVEGQVIDVQGLKAIAKAFITNRGKNTESSESPQKAVISLRTNRETSYEMYIEIRDNLKLAYAELRAEYLGISVEKYRVLVKNRNLPENKGRYNLAKKAYPEMISDGEPTNGIP